MAYLGTKVLGDRVPLQVQSRTPAGVPTMPDNAPTAMLYQGATIVKAKEVKLPIVDRYGVESGGTQNAFFQKSLFVDSDFSAGDVAVRKEWVIGGVKYSEVDNFTLRTGGGDADGNVIGMDVLPRASGVNVLYETESGNLQRGINPS
jgi:hypothetical protein